MSALERELIERIKHLSERGMLRVLETVKQVENASDEPLTAEAWRERVRIVHEQLRPLSEMSSSISAQDLLDEVREEASWPRG